MTTATSIASGSPQSFTDPLVLEAELDHVFRPSWICAGHISQLKEAGDFITMNLFGAPIIVLRDEEGEIRALSNVCLHRSMPIATGCGNAQVLTCPYHLWAYGLDGHLKSTPLMRSEEIDKDLYRLPCLAIEIWQGFIFVNRNSDPEPLTPQLAPLTEFLAPHGMDQMVHVGTLDYPSPWNWKVMVENFMEAYHHIGPHQNSLQTIFPAHQSSQINLTGPFSVLDMPGTDDRAAFLALCIYPNTLLAIDTTNPRYLNWFQMSNIEQGHFDLSVHVFLEPGQANDPDTVKASLALTDGIHQEDIVMCEGVQTGVQSPFATMGPLADIEAPVAHFRNWVDEQLSRQGT